MPSVDPVLYQIVSKMVQEDGLVLTPGQIERGIIDAVRGEFSADLPRHQSILVDGTGGDILLTDGDPTLASVIASGWTLSRIESPINDSGRPRYLERGKAWILYPEDDDPTAIRFITDTPSSGTDNVRVIATKLHTPGDGSTTSTSVKERYQDAVGHLATALALGAKATRMAGNITEPFNGNTVDTTRQRAEYTSASDWHYGRYKTLMKPTNETLSAAGVSGSILPEPSWGGRYLMTNTEGETA